jgi:hypothetical protein
MSKEHESFIYDKSGKKFGPIRFTVEGTSDYDLLNAMPIDDELSEDEIDYTKSKWHFDPEMVKSMWDEVEVQLDKGLREFFETLTPEQIESLNEEE